MSTARSYRKQAGFAINYGQTTDRLTSVAARMSDTLLNLRSNAPFPCDKQEILDAVVGPELAGSKNVPVSGLLELQSSNVRRLLYARPPDKTLFVQAGHVRFVVTYPRFNGQGATMELPPQLPCYEPCVQWGMRARREEERIRVASRVARAIANWPHSIERLAYRWEEIVPFLPEHDRAAARNPEKRQAERTAAHTALNSIGTKADRELLTTLLAEALLLPAWHDANIWVV